MAKNINMVWGPHIARVKTKNIMNLRIGLFKAPLSYVELIVIRTDYLRGPFLCAPPPGWGDRGALVSALPQTNAQNFRGVKGDIRRLQRTI